MTRRFPSVVAALLFAACSDDPDEGPAAGGGDCTPATGAGTVHEGDMITSDTVWAAADGPHHVTYTVMIHAGATLTIEPCTQLFLHPAHGFSVDAGGKLLAAGTAAAPIAFDQAEAEQPWGAIFSTGGEVELRHATLAGGGSVDLTDARGVIEVRADGGASQPLLRAIGTTIDGSELHGISLVQGARFTDDSEALTIRGASQEPLYVELRAACSIPTGSYAGNAVDQVVIDGDADLVEDATLSPRGLPYVLGTAAGDGIDARIGSNREGGGRATLTIEPGVTLLARPGGRIQTGYEGDVPKGAIVAAGTAEAPIVFASVSATPAAGDWVGIVLNGVDPATSLSGIAIRHAGGPSQARSFHCAPDGSLNEAEDAALIVYGEPAGSFVTGSSFTDSAGYGISRAWSGAPVDLAAGNTFERIAASCAQSFPRAVDGSCPTTVPCE
jgi:hypothetical protein